jgi:hypothetical protein
VLLLLLLINYFGELVVKLEDIQAIQAMNPSKHLYLVVVGKGDNQHLSVVSRGFWGRLWMKLGFSSSSMEEIAKYIVTHAADFTDLDSQQITNGQLLKEKVSHYTVNHPASKITAQALTILNKTDSAKKQNNDLINFINQFENSAPVIFPLNGRPKEELRKLYHAEVSKLENFLILQNKKENPVSEDLVYICVGHADLDEQVWPGFIFDALKKNQKVMTVLFEYGWKYPAQPRTAWRQMKQELERQPQELQGAVKENISHFAVQQFLCGFPSLNDKFEETLTENEKRMYPFLSNIYWEKKEQAVHVLENFRIYLDKQLREGKQVVIGSHAGWIALEDPLVSFYNQLQQQYPGQIHFLWGWGRCNLLSHQELKNEDLNPTSTSSVWTHYTHLKDCHL